MPMMDIKMGLSWHGMPKRLINMIIRYGMNAYLQQTGLKDENIFISLERASICELLWRILYELRDQVREHPDDQELVKEMRHLINRAFQYIYWINGMDEITHVLGVDTDAAYITSLKLPLQLPNFCFRIVQEDLIPLAKRWKGTAYWEQIPSLQYVENIMQTRDPVYKEPPAIYEHAAWVGAGAGFVAYEEFGRPLSETEPLDVINACICSLRALHTGAWILLDELEQIQPNIQSPTGYAGMTMSLAETLQGIIKMDLAEVIEPDPEVLGIVHIHMLEMQHYLIPRLRGIDGAIKRFRMDHALPVLTGVTDRLIEHLKLHFEAYDKARSHFLGV